MIENTKKHQSNSGRKNDKEKFKTEFKRRMYQWTLKLIKAIDNRKLTNQ